MNRKLVVSSSPHVRSIESTQSIMVDVLIALFPVALVSVFLFGYRALLIILVTVFSAMLTEAIWLKSRNIFGDGSAAVTGLLLAMILPATIPWWMAVIGAVAAIIVGKQVYGGIGYNIFNPALVGRAILFVSWGSYMGGNIWPAPKLFKFGADLAAVTGATPLANQGEALEVTLSQLITGNVAGCLGETSALAILLGAFWLFSKKHIDWRIPGGFLGIVFAMGALLGGGFYHGHLTTGLFHLLAGGVLLGALFMATDLVTSPVTPAGKLVFGVGCGLITMIVRLFGTFPEGVTFAILIMNALTPVIDNFTKPRVFGEVNRGA